MSRENKRRSMKKWNHSSRQRSSRRDHDRRIRLKELPRHKNWSLEPGSVDEGPLRFA